VGLVKREGYYNLNGTTNKTTFGGREEVAQGQKVLGATSRGTKQNSLISNEAITALTKAINDSPEAGKRGMSSDAHPYISIHREEAHPHVSSSFTKLS